jgi:hypothetical protein
MGNYSGRPSLTSDKKVNSSVRPFLTSDKEIIKKFFLLYIGNLYQTKEESNNKTKRTQKNNNSSKKNRRKIIEFRYKYRDYIQTISEIYETTPDILFRKLYETTINYRDLVAKINTAQDFYYVNTHGSFIKDMKPKKIPEKTVLIFLTPVNRYGFGCNLKETSMMKESFQNESNRLFIQQNLPCLDKFNTTNNTYKVNTKYFTNYYKIFKNALILYPGQYYFDLNLGFTSKDNGQDMNINYYTGNSNSTDLIKIEKNKNNELTTNYYDILSNIVNGNFNEGTYNVSLLKLNNGIRYIIVDCCRNIDSINTELQKDFKDLGKNIYIYENFMFYYNLIMANCNSIKINTFLPDKQFASYLGYVGKTYSEIISANFKSLINENINKPLSLFFSVLPHICENELRNYISDLLLRFEYDENDKIDENGKIVIDIEGLIKKINLFYIRKKIHKPPFLKYVILNNINIHLDKIKNYLDGIGVLRNKIISRDNLAKLNEMLRYMFSVGSSLGYGFAEWDEIERPFIRPFIVATMDCLNKTNMKEKINLGDACSVL